MKQISKSIKDILVLMKLLHIKARAQIKEQDEVLEKIRKTREDPLKPYRPLERG